MKPPRFPVARPVAVLLWVGVIVLGAWLAAYHSRAKDIADYTFVELIDSFTPTHFRLGLVLDGGTRIIEATARDGSYVVRLPRDATVPELVELCTTSVRTTLVPTAPEVAALRRSVQRALATGRLGPDAESAAQVLRDALSPTALRREAAR